MPADENYDASYFAVCRQVVLLGAEGDGSPAEVVTEQAVTDLLGAPRRVDAVASERMGARAWRSDSRGRRRGEALFVEVRRMRGDGALTLTEHLGAVMKESAHGALSWVRATAARYGIEPGVPQEDRRARAWTWQVEVGRQHRDPAR